MATPYRKKHLVEVGAWVDVRRDAGYAEHVAQEDAREAANPTDAYPHGDRGSTPPVIPPAMPACMASGIKLDHIMRTNPDGCEGGLLEQIRMKNEDLDLLPQDIESTPGFTKREGGYMAARFRRERRDLVHALVRLQKIAAGVRFRGPYGPRTQSRGRSRSTSAASRSAGAGGDSGGSGDGDPEPPASDDPALPHYDLDLDDDSGYGVTEPTADYDPESDSDDAAVFLAKADPQTDGQKEEAAERRANDALTHSRQSLEGLPEGALVDNGSWDPETGAPAIAATCGVQSRIQKVCRAAGSEWLYLQIWARDDRERLICEYLALGWSATEVGLEFKVGGRRIQQIAKAIRERREKPVRIAHERPTLVLVASSPKIRASRKPRNPRATTLRDRIEAAGQQLELALGFGLGEVA